MRSKLGPKGDNIKTIWGMGYNSRWMHDEIGMFPSDGHVHWTDRGDPGCDLGRQQWYLRLLCDEESPGIKRHVHGDRCQIAENKDNGITIEEAMERDRDANGNITEGNLQR